MDCEGEPKLVEDNKEENPGRTTNLNEIKINDNGSCANEDFKSGGHLEIKTPSETNGKELATEKPVGTLTESPSEVSGGSHPTTKGYGLKKWKRIRRNFTKDGGSSVDLNRILKRGLSNTAEPTKHQDPSAEIKLKSEASVASANSSVTGVPGVFLIMESSSDSRFAAGSGFPVITDSENSEDRSSKSSSAATAPKISYNKPLVMGSARDKGKVKNQSGKSSGAAQRAPHEKGKNETSKKIRGEKVKIEKENSYSSVESDSRSSNIGCTQMHNFSGISNGQQSDKCLNYDGENSDEAQGSEPQSSEEVRTDYHKDNRAEVEDIAQDEVAVDGSWEAKEEESVNHQPSSGRDRLLESIIALQEVQETLKEEIQNFGEIGKGHISLLGDLGLQMELSSIDPEIHQLNSFGQFHLVESEENGLHPLEDQFIRLNQKVNLLENKLEEAAAIQKTKESRIVELEAIINGSELPKKEPRTILQSFEEKYKDFKSEVEDLFKQKIEAEIEYVLISRTTQNTKVSSEDQITLFEEQRSLSGEQTQMIKKLKDAEMKAVILKRQAEELEASCEELLKTEEVLKMQNRVCEYTMYFFVQLLLLFLVFCMFLLQLLPHSAGIVPT